MRFPEHIHLLSSDEDGSSSIEYALVLALIGLAVIYGASWIGSEINNGLILAATQISITVASPRP